MPGSAFRHDQPDFGWRIELTGALPAPFRKFANKVFITLADDVRLDIVQPEALGADGLDQVGESVVVDVALAVRGGVEIDAVDNALQQRVLFGDVTHMRCNTFANFVRNFPDNRPDRIFRIIRLQRQVETHQLVIPFCELKGFVSRTDFHGDAVEFVVENVAQALGENQRQDEILVLGRVLRAANRTGGVPDPGFEGFVFFLAVILAFRRRRCCWLDSHIGSGRIANTGLIIQQAIDQHLFFSTA
jgi:hypothetical protein